MATTTASRTLTLEKAAIRFAEPFRITNYVFEAMPSIVAKIEERGTTGRGEAAGVYYLGDDQQHMLETIETVRAEVESGLSREELQDILPPCGGRNALGARGAADCAAGLAAGRRSRSEGPRDDLHPSS